MMNSFPVVTPSLSVIAEKCAFVSRNLIQRSPQQPDEENKASSNLDLLKVLETKFVSPRRSSLLSRPGSRNNSPLPQENWMDSTGMFDYDKEKGLLDASSASLIDDILDFSLGLSWKRGEKKLGGFDTFASFIFCNFGLCIVVSSLFLLDPLFRLDLSPIDRNKNNNKREEQIRRPRRLYNGYRLALVRATHAHSPTRIRLTRINKQFFSLFFVLTKQRNGGGDSICRKRGKGENNCFTAQK